MSSLTDWMHDDITWCVSECDKKECFRNIINKKQKTGYFSGADLKGTIDCPYNKVTNKDDLQPKNK